MKVKTQKDNIQNLEDAKEKLDLLSSLIGRVLDGKLTQDQAAEMYGMTPKKFWNQIQKHFDPLIHNEILPEGGLTRLICTMTTPAENLAMDVLASGRTDKHLHLDYEIQDKFLELAKKALSEKDYQILEWRYGLDSNYPGVKGKTLAEIGKEYGVQREWIRRILLGCLRRLRNPAIWKQLLPDYGAYTQCLTELEAIKEWNEELQKDYREILSCIRWIQHQEGTCRVFREFLDKKDEVCDLMVTDMPGLPKELAIRFSYCGIHSISDLERLSLEEAENICLKMGISMEELENICYKACMYPDHQVFGLDASITEMDLSARSFNALNRAGVLTVRDIARTGNDLMRIRSIGSKCYDEIKTIMKDTYKIDIESANYTFL